MEQSEARVAGIGVHLGSAPQYPGALFGTFFLSNKKVWWLLIKRVVSCGFHGWHRPGRTVDSLQVETPALHRSQQVLHWCPVQVTPSPRCMADLVAMLHLMTGKVICQITRWCCGFITFVIGTWLVGSGPWCLPGALSMALKWGAEQPCHLCQPPAHLLLLSEVRIGSEGAARLEMHNPRTMLVSAFCMAPGSSWKAICYAVWSAKLGLYGWNLYLTLSLVSSVTMGKLKSYRQFPHL